MDIVNIKGDLEGTYYLSSQLKRTHHFEYPIVGRSNCGKSSLVNYVVGEQIARKSKKPGRTRSVNKYIINDKFIIADLPGYGYAPIADKEREKWDDLIRKYFEMSNIRAVLWLMDSRNCLNSTDKLMMDYLSKIGYPVVIVLTKVDKIKRGEQSSLVSFVKNSVSVNFIDIILTSSIKKTGREEILSILDKNV